MMIIQTIAIFLQNALIDWNQTDEYIMGGSRRYLFCFISFLDQKTLDKVIVKVSHSFIVVKFWVLCPVIVNALLG